MSPILNETLLETVTREMKQAPSRNKGSNQYRQTKTEQDYRPMVYEGIEWEGGKITKRRGLKRASNALISERGSAPFASGLISMIVKKNYWGQVYQMHDRGASPSFGRYVPTGKGSSKGHDQIGFRDTSLTKRSSGAREKAAITENVRRLLGGKSGGDPLTQHVVNKRLGRGTRRNIRGRFESPAKEVIQASRKRERPRRLSEEKIKADIGKHTHPGYVAKDYTKKFYKEHIVPSMGRGRTRINQRLDTELAAYRPLLLASYGVDLTNTVLDRIAKELINEMNT